MFRIGDFSRIARVSSRLLRFYDEIGLFAPAHADPQTGYRYYSVGQLAQLNRILVLKELGFELDQVREILNSNIGAAELRNMLILRRNDVEKTLAIDSQRLRYIETRIVQLETDGALSADDVVVRAEPPHRFLSLRRIVPSFDAARELIVQLRSHAQRILPKGQAHRLVAIAHSPHFEADELDVEFGYAFDNEIECELPQGTELKLRELEGAERMAVCVRVGLPENSHLVTAKIGCYLEATGDTLAGPSREAFLQLPDLERMQEAVVEMQFPIRSRGVEDLSQ
jgi:DNA-binding transcriptional MerR regulator